jgi:hypothetical protein
MRYYLSYDPKENADKYIEHSKIKSKDILELSNDRDFFEMQCKESDEPPFNKNRTEYFIQDYAYYNNANYQVWVNIDFSLPKEMLIAQISQLKDDIDRDEEMQAFFKSQKKLYEDEKEFIHGAPSSFAKSIKRQYGDFLFVIDCKKLGYKNQDIIYSIYEQRQGKNTISQDTIRKYIQLKEEAYLLFQLQE